MTRRLDFDLVFGSLAAALILAAVIGGLFVTQPTKPLGAAFSVYAKSLANIADAGRLARCACLVTGDVQSSIAEDQAVLSAHPEEVARTQCDWFKLWDQPGRQNPSFRRINATHVELCLALKPEPVPSNPLEIAKPHDFTFPELEARPPKNGDNCYVLDVSSDLLDHRWGSPLSKPSP